VVAFILIGSAVAFILCIVQEYYIQRERWRAMCDEMRQGNERQ
jgi:hypothetical protein